MPLIAGAGRRDAQYGTALGELPEAIKRGRGRARPDIGERDPHLIGLARPARVDHLLTPGPAGLGPVRLGVEIDRADVRPVSEPDALEFAALLGQGVNRALAEVGQLHVHVHTH